MNAAAKFKVLTNKTTGKVIAPRTRIARSFFSRLKGLLGRGSFSSGEALVIPSCNNIHMFFMKFPIDVLFCSPDRRVVFVQENIKPWRLSKYVHLASFVVELPAGQAAELGISVGDELEIS
jgi:uncharacterized protein